MTTTANHTNMKSESPSIKRGRLFGRRARANTEGMVG